MQRDQFGQWPRRNHYSGRVHARVADHTFQLLRGVEQFSYLRVFLVRFAKLGRVFDGTVQRNIELGGHHLGDAIDVAVWDVHGAAYVLYSRLGRHRPKGDDLRHIVAPILLRDVINDLTAPVHAEIDIDIRHGHALRIQETFKQ